VVNYATGNELLTYKSWTISIVSFILEYPRVFFFPRLTYNLFFSSSDYLIVFVSHTNVLLGRDGEGTSSYRDKVLIALTLRARVLAYKREVKVMIKVYCRKVLRWLREEL